MKYILKHLCAVLLCAAAGGTITIADAQAPAGRRQAARKPAPAATPKADPAAEKARFDEAIAAATPAEKAELLVRFVAEYPRSEYRQRAQESLAVARAAMADAELTVGNDAQAVKLFRVAVDEAPKPYSDRLFNEVIATIPANLFWRGRRAEAYEIAKAIEGHVASNRNQTIALANFYLTVEDGTEAKRVAEAAIKLDEASAAGHQALGMAHRLNFDLEESEKAFAKALELDAESVQAKRMLAEMKRALGKPDEATALYRELLAKDENDNAARTGYVLAMFDAGERAGAEAELAKALETTPGNVFLLAGAAYWYASAGDGAKAEELARQAIAKEPRFIWSHVALARGQMAQGKPVDAEQTLVSARKYGNFPTLQYEIAAARFAAGFYREAAEELRKSFTANADGVSSRLGGRIDRTGKNFTELVSYERRASIFTPAAADSTETAEQMRALLEFDAALSGEKPDEASAVAAAERFARGEDLMSTYRRLYAARALNEKELAADKALEFSRSAIANADAALDVPNAGAAVMASELYEARANAFSNDDFLLIPDVPKQTLSAILRGRIEESSGLALLQGGKAADATLRFRRALSVLPKDSAWWRSATWNLGRSLEAEGKDEEALRTYIASYKTDRPNVGRYLAINALYKKVNGSAEGLEQQIGPSPLANVLASTQPAAVPEPTPAETTPAVTRLPSRLPVAADEPKPAETKPVEEKTEPVETKREEIPAPTDEKPTDPKPVEQPEPVEEKPVEPAPQEPKPEPSPAEDKPAEEKKEPETEPKPLEEKPQPPAEERKEPQPDPSPAETKPEEKKEPAGESPDKPSDEPKPAEEEPKPEPKKDAPAENRPDESKPPAEEPAERRTEESDPAPEEPVKPKAIEPDPTPADEPKPEPAEPKREEPRSETARLRVVKTDLSVSPPKPAVTNPPARNAARSRTAAATEKPAAAPAEQARSRPLFEPVVINVPGDWKPRSGDAAAKTEPIKPCSVGVSQEDIEISAEDGTVALLVSVDEGADIGTLKGVSADEEIEVKREPRIAGIADRIVYVLRSATGKAGDYKVSFVAPCGRKTVNVRVR